MKKIAMLFVAVLLLASCANIEDDGKIIIEGKVKFPDNNFTMAISQYRDGEKVVTDTFDLNTDGSYHYEMTVDQPGAYRLDCQKWQSVSFWAEDEDLKIDFRGQDTAKIKIKNPPYVFIHGGEKNEVMNHLNFNSYRNYQLTIGVSQNIYKSTKETPDLYGQLIGPMYDVIYDDRSARIKQLLSLYGERKSIMAVVSNLNYKKDEVLINEALATLEAKYPGYELIKKYRADVEAKKAAERKLEIGKVAPAFSYPTPDGKMVSPADFKGKILIIDFWASWCGPCRKEIPHLQEIYQKYQDKGVEILSVSIDKNKDQWAQALAEEGMPWTQALAPEAGKQTMKDYQFAGIPYIIILDRNGKMAAKQLRGKKVDAQLDLMLEGK